MSILKVLQEYDQKVGDTVQNLQNGRDLLALENSQLHRQLSKMTALLTRRTVGIGLLLTELRKTMSVEQLDELTMGNLDLVPRVEFPGLTLVFTTTGGQVPVRAANVRTLPEERDLDLEDRLFYESRSYPTVVFAKGRRDGTTFCTSVDQQFLTCSDTAIVIDGDGTDGTGMVTRNRWGVHFTGTFSEIVQALNEQYRQIKDVKK